MNIPRNEYPRPQFVRDLWMSLNGEWDFSFDKKVLDKKINVPFTHQTKCSGIEDNTEHDEVWYERKFSLPDTMKGKKILIHFEAIDFESKV